MYRVKLVSNSVISDSHEVKFKVSILKSQTHLFVGEMQQSDKRQRHRQILDHCVWQPGARARMENRKEEETRQEKQRYLFLWISH